MKLFGTEVNCSLWAKTLVEKSDIKAARVGVVYCGSLHSLVMNSGKGFGWPTHFPLEKLL